MAVFLAVLAGCGDRASDPSVLRTDASASKVVRGGSPPVVVISIDTLRSDFLPAYGYDGVETPALDRFAADGIVFERAYSQYPLTFPSHVSLLTGRLPASAGVRGNSRYRLADDVSPYLPAVLKARGYATAGAVSTFVLRGDTGMSRGFDEYHDVVIDVLPAMSESFDPVKNPIEQRAGSETLELVMPWLSDRGPSDRGTDPFFLFFLLVLIIMIIIL